MENKNLNLGTLDNLDNINNEMEEVKMENVRVCAGCGAVIEDMYRAIETWDGNFFCDEECAKNAGYRKCSRCGNWEREIEGIEIEDEFFCGENCAENAGYRQCHDCGEWVRRGDATYISNGEFWVCDSCLEDGYVRCENCDEWVTEDDTVETWDGQLVCSGCIEWNYYRCSDCGEYVHEDEAEYDEDEEAYYCPHCWNEHNRNGVLHGYSFKPEPVFHYAEGEKENYNSPLLKMGFEDEIDDGHRFDGVLNDLGSVLGDLAYFKHDGSLSSKGIEIVTHPCTLAFYEKEFPVKEMCDTALSHNYRSHDARRSCGLHVHVNRDFFGNGDQRDLNIAKVVLVVSRFWDEYIIPFTRRNADDVNHWAQKSEFRIFKDDSENAKKDKVIRATESIGRYVAVNLQNEATIEFRIFRGTLKPETILATLQFVDTICRFVKGISIDDIDNLKWMDLFSNISEDTHKELFQYLRERGISENKMEIPPTFVEHNVTDSDERKYTNENGIHENDIVRVRDINNIREDAIYNDNYPWGGLRTMSGVTFVSDMESYCGQAYRIYRAWRDNTRFNLADIESGEIIPYNWSIEMVNLVRENA